MTHIYARPFGRRCALCPRYFWPVQGNQKYCSYSCSHAASVLYVSIYDFIRYRKKHHKEVGAPIDAPRIAADVDQRRRRREEWDAAPWA